MKCPMKFGGEKRVSCSCERDACAWWVEERNDHGTVSACAVAFMAVGDTGYPRSMNGEFRKTNETVSEQKGGSAMGKTCKNVDKYVEEDGNNGIAHFTCSECGSRLRTDYYENDILSAGVLLIVPCGGGETWTSVRYCPFCGSRVMD